MKSEPGTYALIMHNAKLATVQVGRWGQVVLDHGYYIYIGSAFGPGGVRARIRRHCRKRKSQHWHIDYVREFLSLYEIWYNHDPKHLEHHWADLVAKADGVRAFKGFGCSDCHCQSHFFYTKSKPLPGDHINLETNNVQIAPCP